MPEPAGFSLYTDDGCPYCTRVREAMARLDLRIELRDVVANARHARALKRATGRRTVPCLRIDAPSGEALWMHESRDIVEYLEERFGG